MIAIPIVGSSASLYRSDENGIAISSVHPKLVSRPSLQKTLWNAQFGCPSSVTIASSWVPYGLNSKR
jgi:hypothetical protein